MTNYVFTDETLSAFLDNELDSTEMARVRDAIATNMEVANRVADLSEANKLVIQQAENIDTRPMPSEVLAMLQDSGTNQPSTRLPSAPLWWQRPLRLSAAGAMLGLVLAIGLTLIGQDEEYGLSDYEQQLAQTISGEPVQIDGGQLTSRFSFQDNAGRYCRQYHLQTATRSSENIACHSSSGWILIHSEPVTTADSNEYQTASQSSPAVGQLISEMMSGDILSLEQERRLIEQNWQLNN